MPYRHVTECVPLSGIMSRHSEYTGTPRFRTAYGPTLDQTLENPSLIPPWTIAIY